LGDRLSPNRRKEGLSVVDTTINEALIMTKMTRDRLASLRQLRSQVSVKETFFGTKERLVEPQYDVRAVDAKIVELENFIYMTEAAIKASNARTKIQVTHEMGDLLSPLK
jgi:hypothetical protein